MMKTLNRIIQNIKGAEHVKKHCTEESLESLLEWAQQISHCQKMYRQAFDEDNMIVHICKPCAMCCVADVGTGGHINVGDAFYYSMLNIDFQKYMEPRKTGKCLFWSPDTGCNLPNNARPHTCMRYVCNINYPLRKNKKLEKISARLDDLYSAIPLQVDSEILEEQYGSTKD